MSLKFRVWSPALKHMYRDNLAFSGEKFFLLESNKLKEITDGVLMQFTGGTDMKGNDIFEFDIVDYPLYSHDPSYFQVRGTVKNVRGKWIIYSPDPSGSGFGTGVELAGLKHISIVGNIYEDSDLLSLK